ncbi:MAG: DegT/DnrJ/EryC1/StrS family aminotransferase [Nitrospirae bacterium]|nr:DegT/DnrJ/EryC1/StrS family aminotransferase [Nitrospirota bacterium]
MTFRIIPTAGTPVTLADLAHAAVAKAGAVREFEGTLATVLRVQYVSCAGSATAAMYYILLAMKRLTADPWRNEVVLPAYTAGAPALAIMRAGLVPRLAEVSLASFNAEPDNFMEAVGERTLAVVPTSLFGIPVDAGRLRAMLPSDVFVLEDAAQSMGSALDGRATGTMGDAGVVSFQRGKNMSTYSGGVALTDREDIAALVAHHAGAAHRPGPLDTAAEAAKLALVSAVVCPSVYGLAHRLVAPLKSTGLHEGFRDSAYTPFQAGVGLRLLARLDTLSKERAEKGMYLISALSGLGGITTPALPAGSSVAFAHFPLLVSDEARIERIQERLLRAGMETSRFYMKPLQQMMDLGYSPDPDPYPDATYLARHLLLIPVHHYSGMDMLEEAARVIKETA